MNVSYEDMTSCIQEWFAQAITESDVARIYFTVRHETERQLEFMLRELAD